MFIVLSVISKDVVDLWEAVITFLMFPLVVILAFLVNERIAIKILNLNDLDMFIRPRKTSLLQIKLTWKKRNKHLY